MKWVMSRALGHLLASMWDHLSIMEEMEILIIWNGHGVYMDDDAVIYPIYFDQFNHSHCCLRSRLQHANRLLMGMLLEPFVYLSSPSSHKG